MSDEEIPRFSQRLEGGSQVWIQTGASSPLLDIEGIRAAALKGDPDAQYQMAYASLRGLRVEKDKAEFRRWLEMASQGGSAQAQHNLGVFHWKGLGDFEVDLELAGRLLALAAESGEPACVEMFERFKAQTRAKE